MLTAVHPKLPMRDKKRTIDFYVNQLGFQRFGEDYDGYLMVEKDEVQLHFFEFRELDPYENYGQIYIRVDNIQELYQSFVTNNVAIHPSGKLELKPWKQWEFALLDPDHNLLTFGQEA